MLTVRDMREIVAQVDVWNCWRTPLDIDVQLDGDRPYLQVISDGINNETLDPYSWRGRKWFLSHHMCRSEVVSTAFKAVLTAVEHEVRELFTYRGEAIYDGHMDVDRLHDLKRSGRAVDVRTERGASEFDRARALARGMV